MRVIGTSEALVGDHGRNADCEIVLVGADSLEMLRTTHAHYFGDQMESTSPHLAGV
jgi:hypothetical protein